MACGHVPTPLHCPPLRSVFFPLSLIPLPLFWPPDPLLPLLSLKSVTPHCLFILFGTLSSFHLLLLLLLLPCKVGMSCLMFCFVFFVFCSFVKKEKKNLMSSHQATSIWRVGVFVVFLWGLYHPFRVWGLCEESKVRAPHKAAAFHFISDGCFFWLAGCKQTSASVIYTQSALQRAEPCNRNVALLNRHVEMILHMPREGLKSTL